MPTLDQLRALAMIQDEGTFGGAAARLHRVQSAVSYAVKSLEEELGVALFDRSGHRSRLTEAGEAVLRKGREVIGKADELTALGAELRKGWEPRITLLLDGVLPIRYVLPRLSRFTCGELPSQFTLRVELLGGVVEALERDRPDVAIIGGSAGLELEGYAREAVGEVVMVPVVARHHALAAVKAPIPLETLRRHVHLIVSDSTRQRAPMDAGLVGATQRFNFPDFLSRLEGLRAGLGFAWMPTYLVEKYIRRGTLVLLAVEGREPVRERMDIVWRTRPALGRAGRMLRDTLREPPRVVPLVPEAMQARLRRKTVPRAKARGSARRRA